MDFSLTDEQQAIREMACNFGRKELKPLAPIIDKESRFPEETVKKLAELQIMGVMVSPDYGGAGLDAVSYAIIVEELSRFCASTGVIVSAHNSLACHPIYAFGTDEQKKRFLTPMAKGETIGAFGLTEPSAGSDPAGMMTMALDKGDHYLLNGSKIFITNGNEAGTVVVFAKTDVKKGHKGISAFIVEKGTPGFSVGKIEEKLGIKASSTAELIFDNCAVPKENLLGAEGDGFKIAMNTLDGGRIGIAAQALGIAQASFDVAKDYAKERVQFGKKIGDFQGIQFILADMATRIEAARLLTYQSAVAKDKGQRMSREGAMAKLYASETAMWAATKAVQILGGYGYTKDYPVERFFRDAKITEIYEGTSEIQRIVIAASYLKD